MATLSIPATSAEGSKWPVDGVYRFADWDGPPLEVLFTIPKGADRHAPILMVIPGAKRNAADYRDQWHDLAVANNFITLVIGAPIASFPTEYDYNLGGVVDAEGIEQPIAKRLFASIERVFDDFVKRYGSNRETYDLYGHSAGGGFVHRYLLFNPRARVGRAVAANPAFVTLPDIDAAYPFGIAGVTIDRTSLAKWYDKRLVILLGDRDLDPRTKPLSNSEEARLQGPHVFARGLKLFREALASAREQNLSFRWQLEVVPNVGHSNTHMASHAVKHLCQE
ncbi:MAG: alpha/beta hydrolase [Planctomycetota bacterium]